MRRRLADYDLAISEGNLRVMRDLKKALGEEERKLELTLGGLGRSTIIGAAIGVGALYAGIGEPGTLGLIAVADAAAHGGAHYIADGLVERVQERLVQPDRCYLTNLRIAAEELGNAMPRIEHIWGLSRGLAPDHCVKTWDRISKLGYA